MPGSARVKVGARRLWSGIGSWLSWSAPGLSAAATSPETAEAVRERAASAAPILWLLGKVQSGKSSIVQRLTGAGEAEVGEGFKPVTRSARMFSFPADAPLLRFLDTRGLGETGYDPAEDIAAAAAKAELLLVVMRAGDPAQSAVIEAVRAARGSHPAWPVVVAQTWLHALYPHPPAHPQPYPFAAPDDPAVPAAVARCLAHQRGLFDALPGSGPVRFVPMDLTRAADGLPPEDYGLEALLDTLQDVLPQAVADRLMALPGTHGDRQADGAQAEILGYAFAAAGADTVPVVAIAAVPAIQGAMLYRLGRRFAVDWTASDVASLLGALGSAVLVRQGAMFALREAAKLVPVYGQVGGAAAAALSSFAFTYALGCAARAYLKGRQSGQAATRQAIRDAYRDALAGAFDAYRASHKPRA